MLEQVHPTGSGVRRFAARDGRTLSYTTSPTIAAGIAAGIAADSVPVLVMLADGPGLDPTVCSTHTRLPGRRQVFLAARGTGESDPPPDHTGYRLAGHVEDLEDLHEHLGGRPVALHGSGHGARVALAFALAHPGDVTRMVLVAGQLGLDRAFHAQLLGAQRRFSRSSALGDARLVAAAVAEEDLDLAGDDHSRRVALLATMQTWVARPTAATRQFLAALTAAPVRFEAAAPAYDELVAGLDLRVGLARVTTPTLVIAGGLDVTVPAEHLRAVAAALPHGCLALFEDVGHLIELEAPEAWRRGVCEFLGHEVPSPLVSHSGG